MLSKIRWPSLKALGLLVLFSILYGIINTAVASSIKHPVNGLGVYAYISLLTAIIEWYLVSYYLDANAAKRMMVSNLLMVVLVFLTIYLFFAVPQVMRMSGPGISDVPGNPYIGLTVFIAQLKYACYLFPLRYNKKHVKHKSS